MLCQFGQRRNVSVAMHYLVRGGSATSKAAGDYVAVPELFGQNAEPTGSNEEKTKKNKVLFLKVYLTNALKPQTCNHDFLILSRIFSIYYWWILKYFPIEENPFIFLFILFFNVSAREEALWCPFSRIRPVLFRLEDGGTRSMREGMDGMAFFSSKLIKKCRKFSLHYCRIVFPQEMATLGNKRKLADISRETQ